MTRRNPHARATGYLVVAVVVAVLLMTAGNLLRFGVARDVTAFVFEPVQRPLAAVGRAVSGTIGTFDAIGDTASENRRLRGRVAELERQLNGSRERDIADRQLRAMLGLRDSLGMRAATADVIARDPDGLGQSITIGAGSRRGIKKGMVALGQRGVVGRVVAVQPGSAQVRLITDPGAPVSVQLAQGRVGGTLRMRGEKLVLEVVGAPTDLAVAAGEGMVTSGLGGNFPKGLPVARATSFHYQAAAAAQLVEATPLDDLARLEYVIVDLDFIPEAT